MTDTISIDLNGNGITEIIYLIEGGKFILKEIG